MPQYILSQFTLIAVMSLPNAACGVSLSALVVALKDYGREKIQVVFVTTECSEHFLCFGEAFLQHREQLRYLRLCRSPCLSDLGRGFRGVQWERRLVPSADHFF